MAYIRFAGKKSSNPSENGGCSVVALIRSGVLEMVDVDGETCIGWSTQVGFA
jgi:hypothetical protein